MQKSLILCTVIISLACVCVAVLAVQWRRIQTLRLELLNLEQHVMSLTGSCGERGTYPYTTACCGVGFLDPPFEKKQKEKRCVIKTESKKEETEQGSYQKQQSSVPLCTWSLPLFIPTPPRSSLSMTVFRLLACYSDERDLTVLTWALGQSYGAGLQLSGETVTVVNNGTYFIYSQVLYKDTTWVMGHVITKRINGAETKLMKCLKSMPRNVSLPLNSCYTA
ncbi:hypothetical protein P4O66_016215, partial [Electrophorus voltai]